MLHSKAMHFVEVSKGGPSIFIQYSRCYMHHLTCPAFTVQKAITEHFIIGCTCRTGFPGPLSIWAPYSISRRSPIMIQETLIDWMLSQRHLHSPLHSHLTQTKDCIRKRWGRANRALRGLDGPRA